MLTSRTFLNAPIFRVSGAKKLVSANTETLIDSEWHNIQKESDFKLFNGEIAVLENELPGLIEVRIDEYKRMVSARCNRILMDTLGLRPLAVSGLLICSDGIVFGLRSKNNKESVGMWELVPSGGLDANKLILGKNFDPVDQIYIELAEEIGLGASTIEQSNTFCLIEETSTGLIDIGIKLLAPNISSSQIFEAHTSYGSNEYEKLAIISPDELIIFISNNVVVPVSIELLRVSGYFSQKYDV